MLLPAEIVLVSLSPSHINQIMQLDIHRSPYSLCQGTGTGSKHARRKLWLTDWTVYLFFPMKYFGSTWNYFSCSHWYTGFKKQWFKSSHTPTISTESFGKSIQTSIVGAKDCHVSSNQGRWPAIGKRGAESASTLTPCGWRYGVVMTYWRKFCGLLFWTTYIQLL